MTRRLHLHALARAASVVWPERPGRVVLLTGQSRLDRSPLSPAQDAFLSAVTPPTLEAVRAGAPFAAAPVEPPPGLLRACLSNARQYGWARRDPAYGRAVAGALSPVLSASGVALIVSASAGLALLQAAWPHLSRPRRRLAVLCLGPAGDAPGFGGEVRLQVLRGDRDVWSRALYRGPVTRTVRCGHMGYWRDPDVLATARAMAARLAAEVQG